MFLGDINKKLEVIQENQMLSVWSSILGRHPDQLNKIHESDAELLALPGISISQTLAATIDTVSEEIYLGFYQHPETIGWVAAMASLSDLAAVGATPLGILVSATLSGNTDNELQQGIAKGLEAACRMSNTYVLGGDTNFSNKISVSVCSLGLVDPVTQLTRKGTHVGDIVYCTGLFGDGAALAAKVIYQIPDGLYNEFAYRPVARLKEAKIIAGYANACMDSSDGLLATLDQLSRINDLGIEITVPIKNLLTPTACALAQTLCVPFFPFIASHHGEFELVFTIPEAKQEAFVRHANAQGFCPAMIGKVVACPGVYLGSTPIDTARIRNLVSDVDGDIKRYLDELLKYSQGL